MDKSDFLYYKHILYFHAKLSNAFVLRIYEIFHSHWQLSELLLHRYLLLMMLVNMCYHTILTLVRDDTIVILLTHL